MKKFRYEIEDWNDILKGQMNQIVFGRIPDLENKVEDGINHLKSPFLMQVSENI